MGTRIQAKWCRYPSWRSMLLLTQWHAWLTDGYNDAYLEKRENRWLAWACSQHYFFQNDCKVPFLSFKLEALILRILGSYLQKHKRLYNAISIGCVYVFADWGLKYVVLKLPNVCFIYLFKDNSFFTLHG